MQSHLSVLIDGTNFYDTLKSLNKKAEYRDIMKWIEKINPNYTIHYYSAVHTDPTGFANLRSLLDWMQYNGIKTITKPTRTLVNETGPYLKGNMDIEIAVDALRMAKYSSHIMLFSGDGDFTYLVEELQRGGTFVSIVSAVGGEDSKNFVADTLRRAANVFYDIPKLPWFTGSGSKKLIPYNV